MTTSLVQFGSEALTMTLENAKQKSTTVRLLTAKEFKDGKGLKGQAGRTAYNAYLRESGGANTAGLAGLMSSGELLVLGRKSYAASGKHVITFIEKSKIKDPTAKVEAPGAREALQSELDNLKALLAGLGATEADLAKAKALPARV